MKYYHQEYTTAELVKIPVPDDFPDNPKEMTEDQKEQYNDIVFEFAHNLSGHYWEATEIEDGGVMSIQ